MCVTCCYLFALVAPPQPSRHSTSRTGFSGFVAQQLAVTSTTTWGKHRDLCPNYTADTTTNTTITCSYTSNAYGVYNHWNTPAYDTHMKHRIILLTCVKTCFAMFACQHMSFQVIARSYCACPKTHRCYSLVIACYSFMSRGCFTMED